MNQEKEKSCQERIQEHTESRLEDIDAYLNEDDDTKRDELHENLQNGVLSVDIEKPYKILLSWGSPSNGLTVNEHEEFLHGATHQLSNIEAQSICNIYESYEVKF